MNSHHRLFHSLLSSQRLPPLNDIVKWSATETARNIKARSVSVTEVVEASLSVIHRVNPTINALPEVIESSLEHARSLDNHFPQGELPALYGVPVTTKINVDQAGTVNTNGVNAFADNVCTDDSAVVNNLKQSGAVIVGRSNTPEFSMRWCTSNELHGVSLNPWNPEITPGGSSGAAAASVATGMCAIAHGNDLGGSLRYPAFCCGVASIKPTVGRVPAFNPSAKVERPPITQSMSVQGPITRCVADLKLAMTAMSTASSLDPGSLGTSPSLRTHSNTPRVGYAINPFASSIDPAIEAAMQKAIIGLQDAGIEAVEMVPPDVETGVRLWGELLFTETSNLMGDMIRDYGTAPMQRLVKAYGDRFGSLNVGEFLNAMAARIQQQRAWSLMFDKVDAFLLPTSLQRPFKNDLDFTSPADIPWILDAQKPLFIVNLLGVPAVALPVELVEGVPVGVQLVGARQDEQFLLDLADMLEREIGTVVGSLPDFSV